MAGCRKNHFAGTLLMFAAALAATAVFSQAFSAPVFFPRAQFHYGLERNDYLHRWYDRPLYQNSTFADASDPAHPINEKSWRETVQALRLGKCGIGTFIDQRIRADVIPRSVLPGAETAFLAEFDSVHSGEDRLHHVLRTAEMAMAAPNAFRLDGRVVMTEYGAKTFTPDDLALYDKIRAALAGKFGADRFYILPYAPLLPKLYDVGPVSPETLHQAEVRLRDMLRHLDGFVWDGRESINARRFRGKTRDEIWTPLVRQILDEPEFRGKKLGVLIRPGHENSYLCGYTLDSAGTQTLRENLESATRMRADIVIGAEWDEENENTFFCPTVANGHSSQRILAYYADRWAGRKPSVFPGDDVSIPNLIVSTRRSLMAGEPLEIEVANVPDGTFAGGTFEIEASLCDCNGATVWTWPAQRLSADTCTAIWFRRPVSQLVSHRTLTPKITVRAGGGERRTFDRFWSIDLNATRVCDFKWVKQPLREIATGVKCAMTPISRQDGTVEVSATVESETPLRSVEILDGVDTLRMAGDDVPPADRATIRFAIQGHVCSRTLPPINGFVRFVDAPGTRLSPPYSPKGGIAAEGTVFRFTNYVCSNWDSILFADIPLTESDKAVVEYDLGGSLKGRVRVKDILDREVAGAAAEGGIACTFMRYDRTRFLPPPYGRKKAEFRFTYRAGDRSPVLRLQAIDENLRIWRMPAIELASSSDGSKVRKFHVFERDLDTVSEVSLPENRLDDVAYDFAAAARGGVLWGGCRDLSGLLGGSVAMVCGYGNGASLYGNLLTREMNVKMPDWDKSVPARTADGSTAFKGSAFACLPWSIIPPFAGFELVLDVKPDCFGRCQALLAGSHANFSLVIQPDGTPEAAFQLGNLIDCGKTMNRNVRGPALKTGVWNRIRLIFDQKTAILSVDGVAGEPVAFSGYEYYPSTFVIGSRARRPAFFGGELKNLSIKVR